MHRFIIYLASLLFCFSCHAFFEEIKGKIDVGPTLLNIDVLESGKTVETLHMVGAKADATVLIYQGLYIKPGVLWGTRDGKLWSGGISVGYYLPITKCFKIMPNVGMGWSYLHFGLDMEELQLFHLTERFRGSSPYIGMEFSYSITEKWTLMGVYQYAWSKTQTKIRSHELGTIVNEKSHSCGPNYSLGIEYGFNDQWAVNLGVGYNITLSKEKHGIRGKGIKLGLAYYF